MKERSEVFTLQQVGLTGKLELEERGGWWGASIWEETILRISIPEERLHIERPLSAMQNEKQTRKCMHK